MKAKEMMDKEFVFVSKNDSIEDVSIKMEEYRRFTAPVLDENMKLEGWITSFNITKGLREGKTTIADVMSPVEEIMTINENEAARNVVIAASNNKLISIPIINDENQVIGVCRSVDVVDSMSSLYDIKVVKIYEAMEKELRGVTWDELMEASAKISTRTTGVKITAEEYENNIQNSTFGEAIWATGGLEKFFAGLISVGEIVIARKVGRARR
jgi:predicted transcriptional regulator